jgi:HD superfamily phosphodiesterase
MEYYDAVDRAFEMELLAKMRKLGMINKVLSPYDYEEACEYCEELTRDYDVSHNIKHHLVVFQNALRIVEQMSPGELSDDPYFSSFVLYSCIFHDVLDHKYPKKMEEKRKGVTDFLIPKVGCRWTEIMWIIDNMSYSKEKENGYQTHSNQMVMLVRDICSDADKLEAIGKIGLDRCFFFQKIHNPLENEEYIRSLVVSHCLEKLVFLKDNYIRTAVGKKMAEPRHEVILDFIKNES